MASQGLETEQACLQCHADKRGPFVYEHGAVRVDGCETCHSPHGSTNAKMVRRPAVFTLCLECHNGRGNSGRQADGVQRQSSSHNMADPRYQNCTTCHVRIHGSNADQKYLRQGESKRVLILMLAAAIPWMLPAQPTIAPTGESVGEVRGATIGAYNVVNEFETGYRFHTVGGEMCKYRSDVNLGSGLRLLSGRAGMY